MSDDCKLREALGVPGRPCEKGECPFWRVFEHLDVDCDETSGCAIEYFGLLDDGDEIAEWLLSVKERVDSLLDPPKG